MKIRWTKNSVRFRITPGELESLMRYEAVTETLHIANLYWVAMIYPQKARKHSDFVATQSEFAIRLSKPDLQKLADPQNEGVYFSTKGENSFRYFIEKDFPCAHPRAGEAEETSTETFEPPPDFEERKNRHTV